jgi:hypothetical protein
MRLGNFATGILLARFALGPAEWGVYGIAQTVLLVLLSANELGVGLAIVRWEGDARRFAPTVLTLSALSSGLLYVALFAAAPTVAGLLGSPDAAGVLRVMCLCVVIDGVAQVPAGFLTREFAQGKRMIVDALNFVVSTSVTLLLAFEGWGAMSFAWGAVAGNVVTLIGCSLAAPGTLKFGWDPDQARALLRLGLPLAGASMLALAVVNVDTASRATDDRARFSRRYPNEDEGSLTTRRAAIVSARGLSRIAQRLELGDFLSLGLGASAAGERQRKSVLAALFEAVAVMRAVDSLASPARAGRPVISAITTEPQ